MNKQNRATDKTRRAVPKALSFAAALPFTAAAAVFFRRAPLFGAALMLLSAWAFVSARRGRSLPGTLFAAALFCCGASAMLIKGYFPVLLLFSLSFLLAAAGLFAGLAKQPEGKGKSRVFARLTAAFLVFLFALPVALGWFPDPLFRYGMQEGVMDHVPVPADTVREDGVRVITDVEYPSLYPNNTMLLLLSPENRGTLFFVHGGGFVLGDKNAAFNAYFARWLAAGYNAVSFDYALAPQYRAEDQLTQCGEALRFFMEHAPEWGVDRNRIVLVGESAGGCLSGLLAAASVSPETARALGLPTAAEYGAPIRGWISIGGLVDAPRFGETDDDLAAWAFNLMGVSAFGSPAYAASEKAARLSVLTHASAAFPPAYLSDGNRGTFTEQGKDLARKLRALGVRVETNFVPAEAGVRGHVFELYPDADPLAAENFERTLAFVKEILS